MSAPIHASGSIFWDLDIRDDTPGAANELVLKIKDVVVSRITCLTNSTLPTEESEAISFTIIDQNGQEKKYSILVQGLTKQELSNKMALEEAVAKNLAHRPNVDNLIAVFADQVQKMERSAQTLSSDRITRLIPEEGTSDIFEVFARKNGEGLLTVQSHREYHLSQLKINPEHIVPEHLWTDPQFFIEAVKENRSILRRFNESQIIDLLHHNQYLLQDADIIRNIVEVFPQDKPLMALVLQSTSDISLIKEILFNHPSFLGQQVDKQKIQSVSSQDPTLRILLAVHSARQRRAFVEEQVERLLQLTQKEQDYVIFTLIKEDPSLLGIIRSVKRDIIFSRDFVVKALQINRSTGDFLLHEINLIVDDSSSTPQQLTPPLRYLMNRVIANPKEMANIPASVRQRYAFAQKALHDAPDSFKEMQKEDWLVLIEKKPRVISWKYEGKTVAHLLGINFVIEAAQRNPEVISFLSEGMMGKLTIQDNLPSDIREFFQKEINKRMKEEITAASISSVNPRELSEEELRSMDITLQAALIDHTPLFSLDRIYYFFPNASAVGGRSDPIPSSFSIEIEQKMGWNPNKKQAEDVALSKQWEGGTLLGVFDGHGGKGVAEYASNRFSTLFAYELNKHEGHVPSTFRDLFAKIEEEVQDKEEFTFQGSTAVLCFLDTKTNTVYTATLGDSAAYLYPKENNRVAPLSIWGRWNAEESKRIEKHGGELISSGRTSRDGQIVYRGYLRGAYIEPSRSFGDSSFGAMLSKEPFITATKISQGDTLILASDGILDLSERDILTAFEETKKTGSLISEELCKRAAKVSADDLTVIALRAN